MMLLCCSLLSVIDIKPTNAQISFYYNPIDNFSTYHAISAIDNYSQGVFSYGSGAYLQAITFYISAAAAAQNVTSGVMGCGVFDYTTHTLIESATTTLNFTTNPLLYRGLISNKNNYQGWTFSFTGTTYLNLTKQYYFCFYNIVTPNYGFELATSSTNNYGQFTSLCGTLSPWSMAGAGSTTLGYIVCNPYSGIIGNPFTFQGMITGDIFNRAVIANAPTEITLKQNTNYQYNANNYT